MVASGDGRGLGFIWKGDVMLIFYILISLVTQVYQNAIEIFACH